MAACDPPALAAAGRHALALLRCVCDAAQLVTAAKKCLSAAFHPVTWVQQGMAGHLPHWRGL